jgi:predicted ArsR family transcriptional regulator
MADQTQVQSRALGDPTRHSLFRYVLDAGHPVTVAELTDHLGLNHNAIRAHLTKLVAAGLLTETRSAPTGPGRPKLLYRPDPAAEGRWGGVGPYERLSVMLTEMVRTGEGPEEVGRRTGAARRIGGAPVEDPIGRFVDEMARHGFDPTVATEGSEVTVVLRTCPFTSAVLADPRTVCGLHLGLALGVADAVGGLEVEELEPRDPRRAHCRLRCRVVEP